MAKLRVGLLFGGRSVEHEVSISSAASILRALDPSRYDVRLVGVDREGRWHLGAPGTLPEAVLDAPQVSLPPVAGPHTLVSIESGAPAGRLDVVIPMIHGTGGEDGSLQGLLELACVPYVGAGVLGSALQMDKDVSKRLLRAAGLPILPWIAAGGRVRADAAPLADRVERELGLPVFVKPAGLGSSVGISKVRRREELAPAVEEARRYDAKVVIERGLERPREIEVGVIGNEHVEASLPGEIRPRHEFYDYEAKYVDDATELIVPAPLSSEETARVRQLALDAYRALEGAGLGRVDFLMERAAGELYVSEVNSLPGFTEVSMFPRLWQASGLGYPELLDRLIELALERHAGRARLETTYRRG